MERLAGDTVKSARLGINVVAESANVMELELKPPAGGDSQGWVLTAELKCRAPNGSSIPVWKHTDTVVPRQDPAAIKLFLYSRTKKFFKTFTDDVRKLRVKIKPD